MQSDSPIAQAGQVRPSVKSVMAASEDYLQLTHVFLARIRCLQECIRCFKDGLHLPESICYVCDQCPIKATKHGKITLHASPEPSKQTAGSDKAVEVLVGPEDVVYVSGEEYCNSVGQWAAIRRVRNACCSCCYFEDACKVGMINFLVNFKLVTSRTFLF